MDTNFFPNIIKAVPESLARLTFQNGLNIETEKEIASHQIRSEPSVSWDAEPSGLYTLLLVEAVATKVQLKTRPQICYWMIVNIPGNSVHQGQVLIEYNAPTRHVKDNGLHRLIFLIFKQTDIVTTENFLFKISKQGRIIVKTSDFSTRYSLGSPVAGNYYKVRDD